MADEFAQRVKGNHEDGDTIVATDGLQPIAAKKGTTWTPLEIDNTSGGLLVDIVDASGISVDVGADGVTDGQVVGAESGFIFAGTDGSNYQFVSVTSAGLVNIADGGGSITVDGAVTVSATDLDIRDLASSQDSVEIATAAGQALTIDGSGFITANINGSVTVSATDLDIRDLSASQDNVAISDGTDTLAVNADGSINVSLSGTSDSVYTHGSATLVKDTTTVVVTKAPGADTSYKGIMVSGAGLCQWTLQFGTTASEATILEFWTTPSNPTQFVDLPDSIIVSSGETIRIQGTNRENAASTASDFTGFASLIEGA